MWRAFLVSGKVCQCNVIPYVLLSGFSIGVLDFLLMVKVEALISFEVRPVIKVNSQKDQLQRYFRRYFV